MPTMSLAGLSLLRRTSFFRSRWTIFFSLCLTAAESSRKRSTAPRRLSARPRQNDQRIWRICSKVTWAIVEAGNIDGFKISKPS